MAEKVKVEVPQAPPGLPESIKARWAKAYVDAHEQAQVDHPEDSSAQQQYAVKEANKVVRVPRVVSLKDLQALEPWHFVKEPFERNGKIVAVTIDGKKFSFDVKK